MKYNLAYNVPTDDEDVMSRTPFMNGKNGMKNTVMSAVCNFVDGGRCRQRESSRGLLSPVRC